jgi:hypothetical protein
MLSPHASLELWQCQEHAAVLIRGGAQELEHSVKYLTLTVTHEDWLLGHQLSEDAANTPHVHPQKVVL